MLFKRTSIVIHVGVHKTATTHLQSRLFNSRKELEKKGITYLKLGLVRKVLTRKLQRRNFKNEAVIAALSPWLKNKRLLISDENIIGSLKAPDSGKLYPKAFNRMKRIMDALSDFNPEVYVTLRSYEDYMISRYSEFLRNNDYMPFDNYYQSIDYQTVNWLCLLNDLYRAGCKNLIVSEFSDTLEKEDDYIAMLLGGRVTVTAASQGAEIRRARVSQEILDAIKSYALVYPDRPTKMLMRFFDSHSPQSGLTKFIPFSDEQRKILSENYQNDLLKIKSDTRWKFFRIDQSIKTQ